MGWGDKKGEEGQRRQGGEDEMVSMEGGDRIC